MTKDTKEIARLVLCIAAAVSLAVVIYAMLGKTAGTGITGGAGTKPVEERTLPERLDAQDDYENYVEKGLSECKHITTLDRTFMVKDLLAYEYRKHEYKTDEIVLYFDKGVMVAAQITDVIFW